MNLYETLNKITLYIENHVEEKVEYKELAKIMGVNINTMQKIFALVTNISLSQYIRKRKLSNAAYDLVTKKYKVLDIAIKYGYESGEAFSRAFQKFHKIQPSKINKNIVICDYPRIVFDSETMEHKDIFYSIVDFEEKYLYGVKINTTNTTIANDAPEFIKQTNKKYIEKYGNIKYCMVRYSSNLRVECKEYYCLYDKEIEEFERVLIKKSKFLKFTLNSRNEIKIQNLVSTVRQNFLNSSKYNIKSDFEIEYYYDNQVDFLIPIQ